jgi:hypothetical protein
MVNLVVLLVVVTVIVFATRRSQDPAASLMKAVAILIGVVFLLVGSGAAVCSVGLVASGEAGSAGVLLLLPLAAGLAGAWLGFVMIRKAVRKTVQPDEKREI